MTENFLLEQRARGCYMNAALRSARMQVGQRERGGL
jgi:hypothetical protein